MHYQHAFSGVGVGLMNQMPSWKLPAPDVSIVLRCVQVQGSATCCSSQRLVSKQHQADQSGADTNTSNRSSDSGDCSIDVIEMQTAGNSNTPSLQQLLTAPIISIFPRFLWTRQNLRIGSLQLSCQLFDRLQGATVPIKVPVHVHVVVQPVGWDAAEYVLSRGPQQLPAIYSNSSASSVPEAAGAPGAGWEEVPVAALPTAAASPGSNPLGPFPAYVSRSKTGQLSLVEIKHNCQLDSYRGVRGSPGTHDIVLFEQVRVCLCMAL